MPLTPFPRLRTERELSALGTPFFFLDCIKHFFFFLQLLAARHLQVGALVAPLLARSHLLLRDLLSGTMMTGLRALGALRLKHNSLAKHLEQLRSLDCSHYFCELSFVSKVCQSKLLLSCRMNGLALILCLAMHLLDGGLFSVEVV